MSLKKNSIENLLKRTNRYNVDLERIDYHMNVMGRDPNVLIARLVSDRIIDIQPDISEKELSDVIFRLIRKCDVNNSEYDSKIDEEMTRFGMITDRTRYVNGHTIPSKNNNGGLYRDDGAGNGGELPTQYEDHMDGQYSDDKTR